MAELANNNQVEAVLPAEAPNEHAPSDQISKTSLKQEERPQMAKIGSESTQHETPDMAKEVAVVGTKGAKEQGN